MFFWNSLVISMIQQILAIGSLAPLHFLNPTWTSGMIAWRASHFPLFHLPNSYLSFWPQFRCDLTFWSPLWFLYGLSTNSVHHSSHCGVIVCSHQWKRASLVVHICLQCRRTGFNPWVRKIPWRKEWLFTPIFLPGEFHGQRSLVGYSSWGCRVGYHWVTNTFTF